MEFGFKASRLWTKSKPSLYALLPRRANIKTLLGGSV
jgi:hypothetical protein